MMSVHIISSKGCYYFILNGKKLAKRSTAKETKDNPDVGILEYYDKAVEYYTELEAMSNTQKLFSLKLLLENNEITQWFKDVYFDVDIDNWTAEISDKIEEPIITMENILRVTLDNIKEL